MFTVVHWILRVPGQKAKPTKRNKVEEQFVKSSYSSVPDGRFAANTWNAVCKATWMEGLPLKGVGEKKFMSTDMDTWGAARCMTEREADLWVSINNL